MWLYSLALAKRNQRRYPDRYKIVRYETMVSQPEETMREVCVFLNEVYVPTMLTLEDIPRYNGFYVRTSRSPVSTDFIGRFRRELSKQEIAFIQAIAGRKLLAFDYSMEPIELTSSDRKALYFIDGPVNLARMAAWRPLQVLRRYLPDQPGHRLTSKMVQRRRNRKYSRTKTT